MIYRSYVNKMHFAWITTVWHLATNVENSLVFGLFRINTRRETRASAMPTPNLTATGK